jgi:hypothetical protein
VNSSALDLNTAFDRAFAGASARDASQRARVPLASVALGQPFFRESNPHELCVRATQVALVDDDELPVVVIASEHFEGPHPVGRVFAMRGSQTVRLVDVVTPLKARARG